MPSLRSRRSKALAAFSVGAALLTSGLAVAALLGHLPPWFALLIGVALMGLVLLLVAIGSARPELQLHGTAVLRGPPGRGLVALTFDDGPDPASTDALLDALEAAGAQATFFVLGDRALAHLELLCRMAQHHEIGVHGWTHHPWLTIRDHRDGARELRRTRALIEEHTGQVPRWYRPAFGVTSPRVFASCRRAGMRLAWCSVRTGDGGHISAATLQDRCARAVDGDILLLHEGARPAREALPEILAELQARGLRPVRLSQLLDPTWEPA